MQKSTQRRIYIQLTSLQKKNRYASQPKAETEPDTVTDEKARSKADVEKSEKRENAAKDFTK